jgi:transcriptional regulator with XRE-family HTH domain
MSKPKTVVAIQTDNAETTRLASALKMWLAFSGMSQRDLAKALECSPSTITRFLDGKEMDAATTLRLFQWMLGRK